MFRKLNTLAHNFIQYLRRGGISNLTLSEIQYGKLLSGKKILITGGSSGIGFAIAQKCLSEGGRVLITGRSTEKLRVASSQLANDRLFTQEWDIQNTSIISEQFKLSVDVLGGLDIVVNNAAFVKNVSYNAVSEEVFDEMLDTNLKSVYFLCRDACNYILAHNKAAGGKIINISSLNALQGGLNPYFLSKWGLNCLTEGLAKEYSGRNIIVNGIAPGICDSSINRCNSEVNAYYGGNRINRIITPKDIAELAVFLMSDAANAIVGQTIVCDGGQTLR